MADRRMALRRLEGFDGGRLRRQVEQIASSTARRSAFSGSRRHASYFTRSSCSITPRRDAANQRAASSFLSTIGGLP